MTRWTRALLVAVSITCLLLQPSVGAPRLPKGLCANGLCSEHLPPQLLTPNILLGTWTIEDWLHQTTIGEGQLIIQRQIGPDHYSGELFVRSLRSRSSSVQHMDIRVSGSTVMMTGSIMLMAGFWDADSLTLVWNGATLSGLSVDSGDRGGRVTSRKGSGLAQTRRA